MTQRVAHTWERIKDLPENWRELASYRLAVLGRAWVKEALPTLRDSRQLKDFNAKLGRRWAIETGIVEGLYDIERGVTNTLIEMGIDASYISHGSTNQPEDFVIDMIQAQQNGLEMVYHFVSGRRTLSNSFIKELHAAMCAAQETARGVDQFGRGIQIPLLKGEWKKRPNNPFVHGAGVYEYCPPEQVGSEMDRLLEMHAAHMEQNVPPEVEAAWLHHRFVQIHPFQDGNGRLARALASMVLIKAELFPLALDRAERPAYIDTLRAADEGDLTGLIVFIASSVVSEISHALMLTGLNDRTIDKSLPDLIRAVAMRVSKPREDFFDKNAIEVGRSLALLTKLRLELIRNELIAQLPPESPIEVILDSWEHKSRTLGLDTHSLIRFAEGLGYRAFAHAYHYWVAIELWDKDRPGYFTQLVISIHPKNPPQYGLMAAVGLLRNVRGARRPHSSSVIQDKPTTIICEEPFFFDAHQPQSALHFAYDRWLNRTISQGLLEWERTK